MNLRTTAKVFSGFLTAGLLSLQALAQTYYLELKHNDESAKKAYFAQKVLFWGPKVYRTAADRYHGLLVLSNKRTSFAFDMRGKYTGGKAHDVQIGMIRPCALNWYAGGFIRMYLGNENITKREFTVRDVGSDASGSFALLEYKGKNGTAALRLSLKEDDDKLLAEFTPGNAEKAYRLVLLAFPGEYGKADLRKRCAYTKKGVFTGRSKTISRDEFYVLFYDSYYDRQFDRGRGCCAFAYNPEEVRKDVSLSLAYACQAVLSYPPGQKAHFVLWDFKNWSSTAARNYLEPLKAVFSDKK